MALFNLFAIFCYYGLMCFGGGSSLTIFYIQDLVYERKWMTLEEFSNFAAISQMTPGPIGINLATFFGFDQGGIFGGIIASIGMLFFPFFLMILTIIFLKKYQHTNFVIGLMYGLKPATFGLMCATLLIYFGFSIFTTQIPWKSFFSGVMPNDFGLNYVGLLIFGLSIFLLTKTKASIFLVIFIAAILGALLQLVPSAT